MDSSRPPCACPFSARPSSSDVNPSMHWECLCRSSWRLSSRAARVRSYTHTHTHVRASTDANTHRCRHKWKHRCKCTKMQTQTQRDTQTQRHRRRHTQIKHTQTHVGNKRGPNLQPCGTSFGSECVWDALVEHYIYSAAERVVFVPLAERSGHSCKRRALHWLV